jgi:hypothetical protein
MSFKKAATKCSKFDSRLIDLDRARVAIRLPTLLPNSNPSKLTIASRSQPKERARLLSCSARNPGNYRTVRPQFLAKRHQFAGNFGRWKLVENVLVGLLPSR